MGKLVGVIASTRTALALRSRALTSHCARTARVSAAQLRVFVLFAYSFAHVLQIVEPTEPRTSLMEGGTLALHVHGGCSGNCKQAGISAVLWQTTYGKLTQELWRCWHVATRLSSEEAEYNALLLGLEHVLLLPHVQSQLIVHLEDQCVISQLHTSYSPKSVAAWQLETNPCLRILLAEVTKILKQLRARGFVCIIRRVSPTENRSAAALAKLAVEMSRDGFVRHVLEPTSQERGDCICRFPGFAEHTMQLIDPRSKRRQWHFNLIHFAFEHACRICWCGNE